MTPSPMTKRMPTQPRPERRNTLAAWLLVLCMAPLAAHAQAAFDLSQLTQLLSQVKSGEATFTEKRTVDMLDRTLESSGRLSFAAPDTFVRETLKPRQDKVAVTGNTVTLSSAERTRTVPLDSVPEAAVIADAIRGTLTGNRALLERHFDAHVLGSAQRWQLQLTPKAPRLRETVRDVLLSGQQSQVRGVVVTMADGDRSEMSIEPVKPGTKN